MSKLYQNSPRISSGFVNIYNNFFNYILKYSSFAPFDFLKFLPLFSLSICNKQSIIISDLASFIAPKLGINFDSAIKNINRFLSNPNYDFNFFFFKFTSDIISNFKIKHPDKKVYIIFDHVHIEDKFTVLMFSIKIGKQGFPLWFRAFNYQDANAFSYELFKEGIDFCHNIIKSVDNNANIIFLADRFWGNHYKLMNYIISLNDSFYIRVKANTNTYVFDFKEGHIIKKNISDLSSYKYKSAFYNDITISDKRYKFNLAISKSIDHKEVFYILTNKAPTMAIKEYSNRFEGIEFLFKSQKSNGFFLEETQIKDLYSFNSLYTCVCIACAIMTMTGIDYAKNTKCYKNYKINNARIVNGKRIKAYSFFHVGLILLEAALDNIVTILKRFILYDV